MSFDKYDGYVAVPDVIFQASTQMLGTKDYVYAMASGAVGDLSVSAGMAGDDSVAHSFAAKYEPAARTIVQGISSAGQALGLTASKLLTMAINYLNAEDKVAAQFTGKIDTGSFAKPPPQPQCEPQEVSQALPMVTGSKEVHEIPVIGKFWPQGNPDHLRDAANVWTKTAELIDDAQRNAGQHAAPIPVHCSGAAVTAFTDYVKQIYSSNPSGGTEIGDGRPLMENLSAACRLMSQICGKYADAIDTCRDTLIALGVTAGIITAAGIVLTIFTFGGSDAAAAAGDAALAADAAVAADALVTAEAELAGAAAVAEAESIIAAELAKLVALGVITVGLVGATPGVADAGPTVPGLRMAVPATVPPLPPIPPSGTFPPYSAQQQAAAAAWAATLQTRDPLYGKPEDIAYQVRVAGQPERWMPTGNGTGVWADGYRDSDGAIVDAKHVRQPGCSPRTLQGLNESRFASQFMSRDDRDEIVRYGQAIANPANHTSYLEIDTDDPETVGYWQYLAAANHVPSDVRYVR